MLNPLNDASIRIANTVRILSMSSVSRFMAFCYSSGVLLSSLCCSVGVHLQNLGEM